MSVSCTKMYAGFFIFATYFSAGGALQCYICESTTEPDCATLKSTSKLQAEECTPDKMNQTQSQSWLANFSKITYYHQKQDGYNVPMYCQKVIGSNNKETPITARFCQIQTGETDPCVIPLDKLKNNKTVRIHHCSYCKTDKCNDASNLRNEISALFIILYILQLLC